LKAAYQALENGETSAPIILNAADEVAVELFLADKIPFSYISRIVLESLDTIPSRSVESLDEIVAFHEEVVRQVRSRWGV
jgi:1-deoxy-D-xylulose-5-phosphate reductoisomerase